MEDLPMKKLSTLKIKILINILALTAATLACNFSGVKDMVEEAIQEEVYEKCAPVDRAEYERAAAELGIAPETPINPEYAVYEVCYINDNGHEVVRSIRMSEGYRPEDPEDNTSVVQNEGAVDICKLLPVDGSMVTMAAKDSCVADFDALVGCGECGSVINIARMESEERAQQVATDGNCANPNFFARGESPIGSSGYTCTNISEEEYRPGVAQSYFELSFSYGYYAVKIYTGYPGMEDLVINLGQETIELIDNSLDQ
jgi:hypothetical protein